MKKLIVALLLILAPLTVSAASRCKVDVPYQAMFNVVVPPDNASFDAIIYYKNSTCPFTLPTYDLSIQMANVSDWNGLYFNLWEADYSIVSGVDNVAFFDFNQTRASILNSACTIKAVSTDGKIVFLANHYWIEGNMQIEISHPTNVSLCNGIF